MDAVAARLQREVARRPYLAADVESLLSRPWVAAVVERTAPAVPACLVVARPSPTAAAAPVCMPCAAAGRVLDEVDKCLADAGRVHKLVDCLGYASRHQSTYAVLDYLEAAFVQDELRGAALAEALAPLLRVEVRRGTALRLPALCVRPPCLRHVPLSRTPPSPVGCCGIMQGMHLSASASAAVDMVCA